MDSHRIANSGSLLFYNASSGQGATARFDSGGNYQFVGAISGFARGWTHINGTASGGVLFYNASTGVGATARIDSTGTYTFIGTVSGFATGWTHITSANQGALLFYNASTGVGATARLDAAGTYTFVGSIPGFAKGWTHIVGASKGSVLLYNASTGEGATVRIDNAGSYTFVRSISGFATDGATSWDCKRPHGSPMSRGLGTGEPVLANQEESGQDEDNDLCIGGQSLVNMINYWRVRLAVGGNFFSLPTTNG